MKVSTENDNNFEYEKITILVDNMFRNNKQHVVLGQKRNCQRVKESGL
jgi:hypothetical protein